MGRAAIAFAVATVAAVLGACGGDPDAVSTAPEAVATPAPPPAPLPEGCSPPAETVRYTSGVATVDITSGPGTGRLDLAVQPRRSRRSSGQSLYEATAKGDLKGEWKDAADHVLYIAVFGVDECAATPDAFVQIWPEGRDRPWFADTRPRSCKVELSAFSAAGVDGAFSCTRLGGGDLDHGCCAAGAGVSIDATGTFSLRA